jgi:hypothetical protein
MLYLRYEQPKLMRIQKVKFITRNLLVALAFAGMFIGGLVMLAWLI